jgi:hypothetical protein
MLSKIGMKFDGGGDHLNPLIMLKNVRYFSLTSKVHLKGALGYISLGGLGGQPLRSAIPYLLPLVGTSA